MRTGRWKSPPLFLCAGAGTGPQSGGQGSKGHDTMTPVLGERGKLGRKRMSMLAVLAALATSSCQSGMPTGEVTTIDRAQGSDQNISSLTSVIDR